MLTGLTPEKAFIFRIVHRDNIPWILDNGIHCASAGIQAPGYILIGSPDLIAKRARRVVPLAPGGTLSDYVPFYFTPYSPMMYNIFTGRGGVRKRNNEEICVLTSSLHHLRDAGIRYLFTNAHAHPDWTDYYDDPAQSPKSTGRYCSAVTSSATRTI